MDDYEHINLKVNDNLDLKCFLKSKGNPMPNIHWLKNEIFHSNESFLSVSKVNSYDHLDSYTCVVSHEALDDQVLSVAVKLIVFCKFFLVLFKSIYYF